MLPLLPQTHIRQRHDDDNDGDTNNDNDGGGDDNDDDATPTYMSVCRLSASQSASSPLRSVVMAPSRATCSLFSSIWVARICRLFSSSNARSVHSRSGTGSALLKRANAQPAKKKKP